MSNLLKKLASRRAFIRYCLSFLGLATLGCSRSQEETAGPAVVTLGKLSDFNIGVNPLKLFRVVVFRDSGGLSAHSLVCTHMTCLLNFSEDGRSLICPCHGSRFNERGEVETGPATKALPWYRLSISDTGHLILHRDELVQSDWRLAK